jgi:hypothetical protein
VVVSAGKGTSDHREWCAPRHAARLAVRLEYDERHIWSPAIQTMAVTSGPCDGKRNAGYRRLLMATREPSRSACISSSSPAAEP